MTLFGIDVSDAQGSIDWSQAPGSGVTFAIAKATEGNGYISKTWKTNVAGMKANGIIPGVYHFLVSDFAGATGAIQCDYLLKQIGDPTGLLVGLDVETEGKLPSQPGTREVISFAKRFHERYPDHPLLIYLPRWYWNAMGMSGNIAQYGPNWQSRYISKYGLAPSGLYASVPSYYWGLNFGGWTGVEVLQFTSRARVNGIGGYVDANAFRGSRADLMTLTGAVLPDTAKEIDTVTYAEIHVNNNPKRLVRFAAGKTVTLFAGLTPGGRTTTLSPAQEDAYACDKLANVTQDPSGPPSGWYCHIVGGGIDGMWVALRDVTLDDDAAPDCSSAVAAAVAPLQAKIEKAKEALA